MVVLNASLSLYYFMNFVERKIDDNTPLPKLYFKHIITVWYMMKSQCLFQTQFMSMCSFKTQVQEINKILTT